MENVFICGRGSGVSPENILSNLYFDLQYEATLCINGKWVNVRCKRKSITRGSGT